VHVDAGFNHTIVFQIDPKTDAYGLCVRQRPDGNDYGSWVVGGGDRDFYCSATPFAVDPIATPSPSPSPTPSFVVNSEADTDDKDPTDGKCDTGKTIANGQAECTLRAAITEANHQGGGNITFSGVAGTVVVSPLPIIDVPVTIDGTTASHPVAGPYFEISGPLDLNLLSIVPNPAFSGLVLTSDGNTLKGLILDSFAGFAVELRGEGGNTIQGCHFGTDAQGFASPNGYLHEVSTIDGGRASIVGGDLFIVTATQNMIGGPHSGAGPPGNIIAVNQLRFHDGSFDTGSGGFAPGTVYINGVNVDASSRGLVIATSGNVVQGNYIGYAYDPARPYDPATGGAFRFAPGESEGISISAAGNTIGGTVNGAGNIIAGVGYGIHLNSGATGNVIQQNAFNFNLEILNATNGYAVKIDSGADGNTIGGEDSLAGNLIEGGPYSLIGSSISSNNNVIQHNYIGSWFIGISRSLMVSIT
jgi:CSLREA domain-containing protein